MEAAFGAPEETRILSASDSGAVIADWTGVASWGSRLIDSKAIYSMDRAEQRGVSQESHEANDVRAERKKNIGWSEGSAAAETGPRAEAGGKLCPGPAAEDDGLSERVSG